MKKQKQTPKESLQHKLVTGIFFSILVVSILFLTTSCAQKTAFLNSSVVPAAKGTVKVKQDNNRNYVINIEIIDLAEVERLQSAKQTYVVWMETDRGNTENLGQLESSRSFLSKQNTASLETVSSYKPIKIFITAEEGSDVRYPGNQIVLTTDTF
ncbi:MAG: hypothetical protein JXR61_14205 [Prolixibacteraceae bacterium]|nr:hypothetical protein [Prolixibacteraceae bacterium]